MKAKSLIAMMSAATLISVFSTGCGKVKRGEYVKGAQSIYCDDGFKNVLEEEIDVFEYTYPGSSILAKYVSEEEAIAALVGDTTDAIISTHELTKDQIDYIRNTNRKVVKTSCIAVDGVALIVNKDNPLKDISMEEISKLLNGQITRWSQLVPGDSTRIKIVFDNQGSSTVAYMRDKFLGGKMITDNPEVSVFAQKNNLQVFDVVKQDPTAIGIISVSWLGDSLENAKKIPIEDRAQSANNLNETVAKELTTEVTVLAVSNPTEENDYTLTPYKPYQAYIASGEYPLFRKVYMITTASGSTLMKSFYDFMTGPVGQKIIANTGVLPFKLNPRVVELK